MPKKEQEERRSYWSSLIADQETSGMTVRDWCNARSLPTNKFYFWRRRLKEVQEEKQIMESERDLLVEIPPVLFQSGNLQCREHPVIRIQYKNSILDVREGCSPDTLRMALMTIHSL